MRTGEEVMHFQEMLSKFRFCERDGDKGEKIRGMLLTSGDGALSGLELEEIRKAREELGLTDEEFHKLKFFIYFASLMCGQNDLEPQSGFELEQREADACRRTIVFYQKVEEFKETLVTPIQSPVLCMEKGEKAYWVEPGTFVEAALVGQDWKILAEGLMAITNERILFCEGDKLRSSTRLRDVVSMELSHRGIKFLDSTKAMPVAIRFKGTGSRDYIAAVLAFCQDRLAETAGR